jgi:Uma2 family endonuclease
MSTQTLSTPSAIEYPETDGLPMAENTKQFEWIVTIKCGLEETYRHRKKVFVAGDLFWYPVEGNNKIRIAPDTMAVFGRPKGHRRSYLQWLEGGIAPQVTFEILSLGNTKSEMRGKLKFYEDYGVQEYYVYDPDNWKLFGWRREGERLKAIPDMSNWTSPLLKIRFDMSGGELQIYGPDGSRFLTYQELRDARDQEHLEGEKQRERADRLAAQLRALGVEPIE